MRRALILLLALSSLIGCRPVPQPAASSPLASTPTGTAAPTDAVALLPAPLYFVGANSGQLMRMERDGATVRQVTNEPSRIDDFAVSPTDSTLAYTTNNTLIQSEAFGGNRIVKVKGESNTQASGIDSYIMRVRRPIFSPDGKQIAFALKGVNLIETGEATSYWNVLPKGDNSDEILAEFFEPTPGWSSDGTKLWVHRVGSGWTKLAGILDLATGELQFPSGYPTYLFDLGAVWSKDGSFIVTRGELIKVDATTMESRLVNDRWQMNWQEEPFQIAVDLVLTDDGRWIALVGMWPSRAYGIAEVEIETGEPHWFSRRDRDGTSSGILAPNGSGALLGHARESDNRIDALFWWPVSADGPVALTIGDLAIDIPPMFKWGVAPK